MVSSREFRAKAVEEVRVKRDLGTMVEGYCSLRNWSGTMDL